MDSLMWFCMIGSVTATVVGVIWFFTGTFINKELRKNMPLSPLHGMFVAVVVAFFLIFFNRNLRTGVNSLDVLITTILNTLRVFSGEDGLANTREVLGDIPKVYHNIMWTYTAIIHLLVPILVAGVLLSVLKGFFPRIRYRLSRKNEVCFFSELNERTVLLAEDIVKNRGQEVLLVFCDNYDEETENVLEWKSRIEEAGGICFRKDISTLRLPQNAKGGHIHFFLLENKEDNNLRLALELADKYKDKQKITIHVSTMTPEAEDLLDSVDKGTKKIKLRLVHETRTMIYNLMEEVPLFLGARDKKISVLIIGGGRIGLEALKAACWCGQIANHSLEIHIVDVDEYTESRFLKQCPGFSSYMDESKKQENCFIKFHCIDVEHIEFIELLEKYQEIGYVICALGDESLNLHIASDIRHTYERMGRKINAYGDALPLINVLVNNPFLHEVGGQLKNAQNQEYKLKTFGNLKEIYTWKLISGTYLDQLAYGVHRIYDDGKEEEARERFESSEYNRKASMVSALHCKYKLYSCLRDIYEKNGYLGFSTMWRNQPTEDMIEDYIYYITAIDIFHENANVASEQRIEELGKLEHHRWNMYMLTEGFVSATKEEVYNYYNVVKNHKNLIAKKHPGIVSWDKLDEVSSFLSELRNKKVNLKEEDKKIVRSVPQILWQNSNTERSSQIRARLLMRKSPPVRHIQFDENGKAKENFTALLIGFGVNGQQLLRTLVMNSQFYGSTISVAVIDDDINIKRKIFEKQYKGMLTAYDIQFYETKRLKNTLNHIKNKQLSDIKYMVICKDKDSDNERTFDSFKELNPWSIAEVYFMNGVILKEQLYEYKSMEKLAMAINYNYAELNNQHGSIEQLWENTDLHSRQSCQASADFIVAMYQIAGFDLRVQLVTKEAFRERAKGELLENLAKTEHLRWNAFHYAMGFTAMSISEVRERANSGIKPFQKVLEAKKHACITEWEKLDALSALMTELTGNPVDYKEADRTNVINMPRTLELMMSENTVNA